MKEKWNSLMAFLGIQKVETSSDGVFMSEESVDKIAGIHSTNENLASENETLKGKVSALEAEKVNSVAANETAINNLKSEHTSLIEAKNSEIENLNTKVATLENDLAIAKGKKTETKGVSDPNVTETKKKLTANQKRAEYNAAVLRGETPVLGEDESDVKGD